MSLCQFTPAAIDDLRAINDYVAQGGVENAVRFVERIEECCYLLADFPRIGVARPEFGSDFRSFVVSGTNYIIVYRPIDDGVQIVRVRHGSQDLRRLFGTG